MPADGDERSGASGKMGPVAGGNYDDREEDSEEEEESSSSGEEEVSELEELVDEPVII